MEESEILQPFCLGTRVYIHESETRHHRRRHHENRARRTPAGLRRRGKWLRGEASEAVTKKMLDIANLQVGDHVLLTCNVEIPH